MNNPMQNLASVMTEKFISADPSQAAKALETLATHEIILLVGGLKAHTLVTCMNQMTPAKAAAVLRRLPLKQASYILAHLEVNQALKLWKEFSSPYQTRLRAVLDKSFVQLLEQSSQYTQQSVARWMNTDFVAVRTETKINLLIERLKTLPRKKLPLICFVTDKEGVLKGGIRTAELAFYSKESVCGSVMATIQSLHLTDTIEKAHKCFVERGIDSLPVINEKGILMGWIEPKLLPQKTKSFWERITH